MAHPSKNKKLEKLLDEAIPEFDGRAVNEELFKLIREALIEFGGEELQGWHPVIEMAKIAASIGVKDELKYRICAEIASYMYPKVKSFEINKKEDKTVNLNIKIAGYAQASKPVIEAEDIELEDEDEGKELGYNDFVLGKTDVKKLDS